MDENNVNDIYLETAYEEFEEAVDEGKFFQAKAVIDRLYQNGFTRQAQELATLLQSAKTETI